MATETERIGRSPLAWFERDGEHYLSYGVPAPVGHTPAPPAPLPDAPVPQPDDDWEESLDGEAQDAALWKDYLDAAPVDDADDLDDEEQEEMFSSSAEECFDDVQQGWFE